MILNLLKIIRRQMFFLFMILIPYFLVNVYDKAVSQWFIPLWIFGFLLDSKYIDFIDKNDEKLRVKTLKKIIKTGDLINERTQIQFDYKKCIWKAVESWALENNYQCIEDSLEKRCYQNKFYFGASAMLKIQYLNSNVVMEVWLKLGVFSLLSKYQEVGIEGDDFRFVSARLDIRKDINKLLAKIKGNNGDGMN